MMIQYFDILCQIMFHEFHYGITMGEVHADSLHLMLDMVHD